jgi:hypothetical protein
VIVTLNGEELVVTHKDKIVNRFGPMETVSPTYLTTTLLQEIYSSVVSQNKNGSPVILQNLPV